MRPRLAALTLLLLAASGAGHAATVVILTDPMSLQRRTMVLESPGPDRVLLCALPPATTGCVDVTKRRR